MNYEKIIVELLGRIQTLEEQVAYLMENKAQEAEAKETKKSTEEIRRYIEEQKVSARADGAAVLVLRSGDIHKALGLKNAMPQVCNAMYQAMEAADVILHTTPKGKSSTIEIEYKV